jgi:predicted dehydrogenase
MGMGHCQGLVASQCFDLAAVCDISDDALKSAAHQYPSAKQYKDLAAMLDEVRPEVVVVATPNSLHHAQAMAALGSPGIRGVMIEKPMTVSLAHTQEIIRTADAKNVRIAVNHQRRTWPVFRTMRKLMDSGAIGVPQIIRAGCAGDFLSDGTHLVDSVRYLAGDAKVRWVAGMVFRETSSNFPGTRFGHATDSAASAVIEFENGLRAELHTGDLQPRGRYYQDYEIFGTEGRLWRAGDQATPQLLLQDLTGGFRQVKLEPSLFPEHVGTSLACVYVLFHQQIAEGKGNPMGGRSGLAAMEICYAVYESARLNQRIHFPLDPARQKLDFSQSPLDAMLAAGRI